MRTSKKGAPGITPGTPPQGFGSFCIVVLRFGVVWRD